MSEASCFLTPTNQLKTSLQRISQCPTATQTKIQSLFQSLTKINNFPSTKSLIIDQIQKSKNKIKGFQLFCQQKQQQLKKQINALQTEIQRTSSKQNKIDELIRPKNSNKYAILFQKSEKSQEKQKILQRIVQLFQQQQSSLNDEQKSIQDQIDNMRKRIMNQKIMIADSENNEKFKIQSISQESDCNIKIIKKRFDSQIITSQNIGCAQLKAYTEIKKKFSRFRSDVKKARTQAQQQQKRMMQQFQALKDSTGKLIRKEQENQKHSFESHYLALEKIFKLVQKDLKNK